MYSLKIVRNDTKTQGESYSVSTPQGNVHVTHVPGLPFQLRGNAILINLGTRAWLYEYDGTGDLCLVVSNKGELSFQYDDTQGSLVDLAYTLAKA